MIALFGAVLVASLLGSLHCAGMCGGLITVYAGADVSRGLARGASHLAYNLGRLVTYAALGALAGSLGAALDLAGRLAGAQRIALTAAGALILAWGTYSLLQALGLRVPRPPVPRFLDRPLRRGLGAVSSRPPVVRAAVIGLLTAFLPCGWLYAFVITAAGTGSAWQASLVMAVFWLGTLPMMVGVGVGLQALAGPLRRHVPVLCAITLMAVGLLTVIGRASKLDLPLPAPPANIAEATGNVHELGEKKPPCCDPANRR